MDYVPRELEWCILSQWSRKKSTLYICCNSTWAWRKPVSNDCLWWSSHWVNCRRWPGFLQTPLKVGTILSTLRVPTWKCHIESVLNNTAKVRKMRLRKKIWTEAKIKLHCQSHVYFLYSSEIGSYFKFRYNTMVSIKCSLVKKYILFFHLWLH